MNYTDSKNLEIHINELRLPAGSRMPDQATLRRLVEAELLRRVTGGRNSPAAQGPPPGTTPQGSIAGSITDHIQRHYPHLEK